MNKEQDNKELLIGKDWEGKKILILGEDYHKAEHIDIQAVLNDKLDKLDKIEKIEIFMNFLNFTKKALSLYFVLIYYDKVFKFDSLLLFSYLQYALFELVVFGASFAVFLSAHIILAVLSVNVFYLDSFIYILIFYSEFKFCFVETFLVQQLTVVIFSKFSDWIFALVLHLLFVTLILQVNRLILMIGEKFSSQTKYIDTNCIFKLLAPENLRNYQFTRTMLYQVLNIFEELNPEYQGFIQRGYKYQKYTMGQGFNQNINYRNDDVQDNPSLNKQSPVI